MERLDFTMPEWTRFTFVTESASDKWIPIINKISEAMEAVAFETVANGMRKAYYFPIEPTNLPGFSAKASSAGLTLTVLKMINGVEEYRNSFQKFNGKGKWQYTAVVARPENAREVIAAFKSEDDDMIGELLGYPKCCRSFFEQKWKKEKFYDITWPMAINTADPQDRVIEIDAPIESNIMLRWIGVRPVFHLPHSFDCKETIEIGKKHIQIGKDIGFKEEMKYMEEMLSWPLEWSALHGIAEVKTPIMKISTSTIPTPHKYTVRLTGSSYPEEGARGIVFPYKPPRKMFSTDKESNKKFFELVDPSKPVRLEQVDVLAEGIKDGWIYRDNEFTSIHFMKKSHEPVEKAIMSAIETGEEEILDFGCGNGFLLLNVLRKYPNIVPYGVDREASRISNAHRLIPEFKQNFIVGDMFDFPWLENKYDIAVLMPGRLIDAGAHKAMQFKKMLYDRVKKVVVYAYDKWNTKYGSFEDLCAEADIMVTGEVFSNKYASATVIDLT